METPLQKLYEWVHLQLKLEGYEHQQILDKITELLEEEKKNIVDAYMRTSYSPPPDLTLEQAGENYYTQPFKQ